MIMRFVLIIYVVYFLCLLIRIQIDILYIHLIHTINSLFIVCIISKDYNILIPKKSQKVQKSHINKYIIM